MIRINNLSKSYGSKNLFEKVNFNINDGERIGLVGRNGHGKTTLMKIITGDDFADEGSIDIPREYQIGFIKQHLKFSHPTVMAEVCDNLTIADDEVWKVEKILTGLGFSKEDMQKDPALFSGGFQVRINLARVLVSDPSILLLDEPTNYLDITSIRWLAQFLREWKKEMLLITHDRSFMDSVVTHTVAIHRQGVRKMEGNTEKLYEQIAKEEEIYEKTRLNDEKKKKEMELFIRRFRAKARLAGMVQSRVKMLEKMDEKEKLVNVESLDFSFNEAEFPAKILMTVDDLSFGYNPDMKLFENLSFNIAKGEKVCIVGKNGKGKSTLLKVLAGELSANTGKISQHPSLKSGYFAQTNVSTLDDNRTVEDEIASVINYTDRQQARNICGAMMFEDDDALKKIRVLSGGEKARVMLGKILMKPINILLLDEPTNHLDMQSCDSLLEAIDCFDGGALIVTHNEMFLHALADRLIVFRNDGILVHDGDYRSFLDKYGWEEEGDRAEKKSGNRKDIRRARSEVIARRSKAISPLQQKVVALEKKIEHNETELKDIEQKMIEASSSGDGKVIADLAKRQSTLDAETHLLYEEFDTVSTELDRLSRSFDDELSAIEGE